MFVINLFNFIIYDVFVLLVSNQHTEINLKEFMDTIQVMECSNPFHLIDLLYSLNKPATSPNFVNNTTEISIPMPRLLVIDNIENLFSSLFKSCYSLDASFYLECISNHLKYLAVRFNIAILVVTNRYWNSGINNIFNLPSWVIFDLIYKFKN